MPMEGSISDFPDSLQCKILENVARLPHYKRTGNISINEHMYFKRQVIGERALSMKRIYLDQRFWIFCRDASQNQARQPIHSEILALLKKGVREKRLCCPFAYPAWAETMKQSASSRLATAQVVDQLSCGIGLQDPIARAGTEISHYVHSQLLQHSLKPLEAYVWVGVGHVVGEAILTSTAFNRETELALQKSMYDLISEATCEEMVTMMNSGPDPQSPHNEMMHEIWQNYQCALHRSDFETVSEAIAIEVDGIMDCYEKEALGFVTDLFDQGHQIGIDNESKTPKQMCREIMAIISAGMKLGRITTQLPSLHIPTGVHAVRRHRRQKYRKGDMMDIGHASAALPYCDAFLTDKTFAELLRQKPLSYGDLYDCTILYKEHDVVEFLRGIVD
jgi:hypothetical protein